MKIAAGETILAHYEKNFCIGEMGGSPSNPIPAPCNETWGHEWGPITAYMAACNGPCEDVDVNDGKPIWFKIYEAGLVNGTAGGGFWEQMRLHNGEAWSVKIPEKLKAGNYLIRHEVIAVHVQPHQFYMECAQLEVTGYGTTAPNDEDLVAFPGAYDPNGKKSFVGVGPIGC
jgi:lytic cellulose monooxygenase (C1-hydroxylating)